MGGAWFQDIFSHFPTDSEIEQVALDGIAHSLGIKQNPTMCRAIVEIQYIVGHSKTIGRSTSSTNDCSELLILYRFN